MVPLTGCGCSLSSNPASTGARQVRPQGGGASKSLTAAEDVLHLPPPAASATILHHSLLSILTVPPPPHPTLELQKLPHALWVCESSTSDRVTVPMLTQVELDTPPPTTPRASVTPVPHTQQCRPMRQ
ncbi:hypothetical protein VZT92_014532 [Zoarces viviparus]|uniref:Uncharacterized protein n=1 Tax=Zoarces viviparus TaxID=48416 RepID=A0AAW1EZC7_ZOAVI